MGLLFKPNGLLNIAAAATDLPSQSTSPGQVYSEALTRCKNLRTNQKGKLVLRDGSSKVNISAISSDGSTNLLIEQAGVRFEFSGTKIFRNESSISTGLTNSQWSGIKYNQFNDTDQQIFALNGTDRKRINGTTVAEWGITPPSAAPTVSATGAGLTGDYSVKITYARLVSSVVVSESNPSPVSATQTLSNQKLRVSWVASADSQVTHVRLYRTSAGGESYFHDQDIAIGATTVDTSTADADLGDLLEEDHDRPPLGQFVSGPAFDGTCFIVKGNLAYFCKPKQPEYWPSDFFVEVGPPQRSGTCPIIFHNGQPYFLNNKEIYLIVGTGADNFLPIPQNAKSGCQGIFGAVAVKGRGIYHTGKDGIYLFAGDDIKLSEQILEPIFRGEDTNGVPGVSDMSTAILFQVSNTLWFGYASAGFTYPNNFLIFNLDSNRLSYFVYNDGSDIEIRCMVFDESNKRILAADTSGFIRELEDKDETTDSDEAIDWEVQSMDYTLQTRLHFPRWAKYDVDASDATSVTGEIIVDDETVQSHSITGLRDVKFRHIATSNGKRCSIRISGTGPAEIFAAELE